VLVPLVGWTLFAFAHSYRLTALPLACGVVLLALLRPPAIGRPPARVLDVALIVSILTIAIQLVPLPAGLRGQIAPAAVAYDSAMRIGASPSSSRPLSIDPASTLLALVVVASMVVLFWSVRTMFQHGGVRATVRAVVWIGLLVSPLAVVHHVAPLPFIDQFWGVTPRGLRPYGPFVNRNDFAGWLIMAIPLTVGYALARVQARRRPSDLDPPTAIDSKAIWLGLAISLMLAGLLSSVSRSGLLGALAGFVFLAWRARGRLTVRRAAWSVAALCATIAVAAVFADADALTTRLEGSVSEGLSGRVAIWRQTLPLIQDFWFVGSGVGTFETVMVRYQTMSRLFYISHADNELLQILAEGGLLLAASVALVLVAGTSLAARRAHQDHTPIFWLRTGAAAGLLAIMMQNMVEMTLRVPANAVLFAILAAIAVHEGD
jgi:hypothetical protein